MILDILQQGLSLGTLVAVLISFGVVVAAITLHEFGHALAARAFGDTTAQDAGRLSLNPVKHYDPVGSTLFLIFGFGWAKPVPVNPRRMSDPRLGGLLTSLAGPFTNIVVAVICAALYRQFGLTANFLLVFVLERGILLNLYLAFFNLLPLPPLDGSHIITYLLPDQAANSYLRFMAQYGQLLVILIILMGGFIIGPLVGGAVRATTHVLVGA